VPFYAATMGVVKNIFNTRALVIYLTMIALCSLLMGFSLDQIYSFLDIEASVVVGHAAEMIPYEVQLVCAAILAFLIIANWCKSMLQARGRNPLPMIK
jgi:hypothetical protein